MRNALPLLLACLGSTTTATAAIAGCKFTIGLAPTCVTYSFCEAAAAAGARKFQLKDTYPEPYLFAAPFATADTSNCPACSAVPGASGYQFAPGHYCTERCIPLGYPDRSPARTELIDPAAPTQGVRITFPGGEGGRSLVHVVHCKPGAKLQPKSPMGTNPYEVTWEGAAGCGVAGAGGAGSSCPTPPPLAKPTAAQLRWQEMEVGSAPRVIAPHVCPCRAALPHAARALAGSHSLLPAAAAAALADWSAHSLQYGDVRAMPRQRFRLQPR
jgi:hypothetical protein